MIFGGSRPCSLPAQVVLACLLECLSVCTHMYIYAHTYIHMTLSLSLTLCISPCQVVLAFASAALVTSRPCSLLAQVVLACLLECVNNEI